MCWDGAAGSQQRSSAASLRIDAAVVLGMRRHCSMPLGSGTLGIPIKVSMWGTLAFRKWRKTGTRAGYRGPGL